MLLDYDGFDWQTSMSDMAIKWTSTHSSVQYQHAGRRASSKAITFYDSSPGVGVFRTYADLSNHIIGIAVYRSDIVYGPLKLSILTAAGAEHLSVRAAGDAAGQLYVSRNGTTLWTSTTPEFRCPQFVWTFIEFQFNIGASGGFSVRVNGSDDALHVETGVNTAGQTTTPAVRLGLEGSYAKFDDYYLCDTTGAVANTMLGDCRVERLVPIADGTYSDFTPSTGTTHYVLVDENPASETDYVSSPTVNAKESFGMEDLAFTPSAIYGMHVRFNAWKADSGSRSVAPITRTEGSDFVHSTKVLGATAQTFEEDVFLNPSTGVLWTLAEVQAVEAGVKVVS